MIFTIEQFDVDDWIVCERNRPIFMMKDHEVALRIVAMLNTHVTMFDELAECMTIISIEAKFNKDHRDALLEKHKEIKDLLESLPKK